MSDNDLKFQRVYEAFQPKIHRYLTRLIFAAIAYWVDLTTGLALVAFMGVMILQSAFTDWCPADLFLRPMGLKRKLETRG